MRKFGLVCLSVVFAGSAFSIQLYSNGENWGLSTIGLETGATAGDGTGAPSGTQWSELANDGDNANAILGVFTVTAGLRNGSGGEPDGHGSVEHRWLSPLRGCIDNR